MPIFINSDASSIKSFGFELDIEKNDIVFTDYMMNVTNSHTVEACLEHDISTVGLSIELTTDRIEKIASKVDASKIAVFVYGKIELMKNHCKDIVNIFSNVNFFLLDVFFHTITSIFVIKKRLHPKLTQVK